jgi:hypothetical protein
MIGIAIAIIGFCVIAGLLIKLIAGDFISDGGGGKKKSVGNAAALSLTSYRDNANSLRGNSYKLEGRIEEMLRWSESGRLISFDASDESGSIPVPVLVPAEFKNVNLERGSELTMIVRVDREGTLVAESISQ